MAYSLETSSVKTIVPGAEVSGFADVVARQKISEVSSQVPQLSAGDGIGIYQVDEKTLITNNISAGSNISLVYDVETNTYRIDAQGGKTYTGVAPIQVNNTTDEISINLSAGDGIDLFTSGGYAVISSNGAGVTGDYVPLSAERCLIGSRNVDTSIHGQVFVQGETNSASVGRCFAQGVSNIAGEHCLSQGISNNAYEESLAQGDRNTATYTAFAQGQQNSARGTSIAQGYYVTAVHDSLAQGNACLSQDNSLAQGLHTRANLFSIAQGYYTSAFNDSQAFGYCTRADNSGMAIGVHNKITSAAFVIGNGSGDWADYQHNSDCFVIYHDGSVSAAGKVSANGVELGAGGSSFPMTSTDGSRNYQMDINSSAMYITTATGAAGATTKLTTPGIQYEAYPATDMSASWRNVINAANNRSNCYCVTLNSNNTAVDLEDLSAYDRITVLHAQEYVDDDYYIRWNNNTKTVHSGEYIEMAKVNYNGNPVWTFITTGWYDDALWD